MGVCGGQSILELDWNCLEAKNSARCNDWTIEKFTLRNVAHWLFYQRAERQDGLEESDIGLKLVEALDFWRSRASKLA